MAVIEYWLSQDLSKPVSLHKMSGSCFTEDNEGTLIGVKCTKDGEPVTLSGTVSGYIIRGDNQTVIISEGTLDGNKASILIPSTALEAPGLLSIVLRLTDGDTKTTLCAVQTTVVRSRTDTILTPSGQTIYGIDEMLAQIAACESATTAANTAASNANSKASAANTAATNAQSKADAANTAANTANAAAAKINALTVSATGLATGASPSAAVSEVDGHKHIAFGIPKGDTGATPNLTIGTVTTLGEDDDATATITGTAANPVLNLGIPQGKTGSASGVYASNTPMSASDSTKISEKIESLETSDGNSVKVVTQTLTTAQKTQARANIGAADENVLSGLWMRKGYSYSFSNLAADGVLTISKSNFGITDISGYEVMAISRLYCSAGTVAVIKAQATGEAVVMAIKNMGSSAASGNAAIDLIWIKSGLQAQ